MFGLLRTLLAINVVLLHVFSLPTLGNYSVSFFFILSGFLMTYIMQNTYGYNFSGVKLFWKNRFLRLYPMYWVVLVFGILLILFFPEINRHPDMYLPTEVIDYIFNILMVFPKIIPHNVSPRIVPPSWALTNELIYYFLISMGISKNKKRTFFWVFISVLYYIWTYFFYNIPTYRYSSIFASSLPFSLGALLYWFKDFNLKLSKITYILGLYLLFIVNAIFFKQNLSINAELSIYLNLIIALLIIHSLFHLKTENKIKKIDNYIGRYSYPIYLSHFAVLIFYIKTIGFGKIENNFKIQFVGFLPFMIVLLFFCYLNIKFIDLPIDKLKDKLKNKT